MQEEPLRAEARSFTAAALARPLQGFFGGSSWSFSPIPVGSSGSEVVPSGTGDKLVLLRLLE